MSNLNRLASKLSLLASALVLIVFGYLLGMNAITIPSVVTAQDDTPSTLAAHEAELAALYDRVGPSIVSIVIAERIGRDFEDISGGSGFVYDKNGHIITNFHVIDGVSSNGRIEVNFLDGTIVRAEVVGKDPESDIAVIRVDVPEDRLFPVTFADSDTLKIGQTTVALGSPFGQRWTMTSGIISALDRSIESLGDYEIGAVIQTDAAINPGNSGGPLLNLRGEVLGVNSQIISEERVNSGIAFAAPSNLVLRVVPQLIDSGSVEYAYLGVSGDNVDLDFIEDLDLPNNTRGVVVRGFSRQRPVSPARDAGLEADDVITAIDQQPIQSFATLLAYLATKTAPGQTITITVLRNGELLDFPVTLGRR